MELWRKLGCVSAFLVWLVVSFPLLSDIAGTWDMIHDDWRGTLVINPSDRRQNAVDGPCTFTSWVIDRTYRAADGRSFAMRGFLGGRDTDSRANVQCKQSDHVIQFTIAFAGGAPQPFKGYLFTHGRRTLAGYTWWEGTPFGWYATKR